MQQPTTAGWYPYDANWDSYWDGTKWADQFRPGAGAAEVELFPAHCEGMILNLTSAGLYCTPIDRKGEPITKRPSFTIPWSDILAIVPESPKLSVVRADETRDFVFRPERRKLVRATADEIVERARSEADHIIKNGALTNSEASAAKQVNKEAIKRAKLDAIVEADAAKALDEEVAKQAQLDAIVEAHERGDRVAVISQSHAFTRVAWGKGRKAAMIEANERLNLLLRDIGAKRSRLLGKLGKGFLNGKIQVFDDHVIDPVGAIYLIDQHTRAQVFLDGQVQVTTRASMTAAAIGSVLPGSAIIPAMAFAKKEKTDLRTAEFHVASSGWSIVIPIAVDSVAAARGIAQQVNSIASRLAEEAHHPSAAPQKQPAALVEPAPQLPAPVEPTPQPAEPATPQPFDLTAEIERIVALERSGALTPEQAHALKNKLLGL